MATETKKMASPSVDVTPAKVSWSIDDYEQQLLKFTEDYALVITDENIANGKAAAAELNKIGKEIKDLVKAKADEMKEPIKELTDGRDRLLAVIDDRVSQIRKQITLLEEKHLNLARNLLTEWLDECRAEYRIQYEFISDYSVESEVKLGSLNAKRDSLTKKARDAVESAVAKERGLQQQTELRLSNLKVVSHENNLPAPLTRQDVEHFLFADHVEYEQKLDALIQRELQRVKQAEEAAKRMADEERQRQQEELTRIKERNERLEREAAENARRQQEEAAKRAQEEVKQQQVVAPQAKQPSDSRGDLRTVTVWLRFDVPDVSASYTNDEVGEHVKNEIEKKSGKEAVEFRV